MKKLAIIIPLAFAVSATAFAAYSFLDTFIVVKNATKVTFSSNFDIPFYEPKVRSEFYDLYEIDSKTIQVQKSEGNIIGGIIYIKITSLL